MSETHRPIGDDRPTGPDPADPAPITPVGLSSGPVPAATRTVLAKGERVPWPRRLIAAGLLSAVLALALHALPRPYQSLPTGVVRGLGDAYGNLRYTYRNDVAVLEPVAGEADAEERKAYARELWRYRWLGSFREILLRFSEWLAASCMLIALSMIVVERRRLRRAMRERGATSEATLIRRESMAAPSKIEAPPLPPQAPEPPALRPPLRQTGDEVTPPHPTPVPKSSMELRPAQFDDDDDLGRTTEGQTLNLAKLPVATSRASSSATPPSPALPVFFAERRHPEPHPVVHPGDAAPPVEPMPTPPPAPAPQARADATTKDSPVLPPASAPRAPVMPAVTPIQTVAPIVPDDELPVWLKRPR